MQLVNYCFINQLDGCMYSFGWVDNLMLIMIFSVKLVNNKAVYNSLIYHVLNFHGHSLYGLRTLAVKSLPSEMLARWTDLKDWIVWLR